MTLFPFNICQLFGIKTKLTEQTVKILNLLCTITHKESMTNHFVKLSVLEKLEQFAYFMYFTHKSESFKP